MRRTLRRALRCSSEHYTGIMFVLLLGPLAVVYLLPWDVVTSTVAIFGWVPLIVFTIIVSVHDGWRP